MPSDIRDDMDLILRQLEQTRTGSPQMSLQPSVTSPARQKAAVNKKMIELDPETIEKNKATIREGYQALFEEIQKLSKESTLTLEDLSEPLPLSAFTIKDEALALLADPSKGGDNGITLVGCSEQSLLGFYLIAKKLYDDKMLDETVNAFILLTHIAPEVSPFWLGLGLAYEAKQDWIEAGRALQKAIEVNPTDFAPFRVLIRIAAEIHDFDTVIKLLEQHKESEAIKEDVATALECMPQIIKGGL
ncbi:MAG: hypothetical protein JSR37_05505 [Verrucomicrobia bacterium]|nr:hypothetical protein [Verrucomicrobiota bacterium]MBS0637203.1 hypothetical protein [Verrucomicrobiota bacterium]